MEHLVSSGFGLSSGLYWSSVGAFKKFVDDIAPQNQKSDFVLPRFNPERPIAIDGFFGEDDKRAMAVVRAADKHDIAAVDMEFRDPRLQALFPLYKARNFPNSLSNEERAEWEKYRYQKLVGGGAKSRLSKYFMRIAELMEQKSTDASKQYLLQELQLYGEAILPMSEDEE